jgi:hypothetical protein
MMFFLFSVILPGLNEIAKRDLIWVRVQPPKRLLQAGAWLYPGEIAKAG